MILFRSIPTLILVLSATVLTAWGANIKHKNSLIVCGILCADAAVLCALVDGAGLYEALACVLIPAIFAFPFKRASEEKK